MRRGVLAVAVVGSMLLLPASTLAARAVSGASGPPDPLANPTHNTQPSARFVEACQQMGTSRAANLRCDGAALKDFDAVRKKEGMGPMTLPLDFPSLSVAAQLLAISDIERVDRGRRPVLGRVKALDKLALQGAKADEDPPFPSPFPGNSATGNWAGAGNSALLDDFYWMYDDGLGSFNIDCQHKGDSGCWGHRNDILSDFDAPALMGTAVAYHTNFGTSMTEEFIGGDRSQKANVAPTWHAIAATYPLRLTISASATRVAPGSGVTVTGKVRAHAAPTAVSGERVELQRRSGTTGAWTDVTRGRTTTSGVVRFTFHPIHTQSYRLQARTKTGANRGVSSSVRIVIAAN